MELSAVAFYVVAGVTLVAALGVVVARSVVYARSPPDHVPRDDWADLPPPACRLPSLDPDPRLRRDSEHPSSLCPDAYAPRDAPGAQPSRMGAWCRDFGRAVCTPASCVTCRQMACSEGSSSHQPRRPRSRAFLDVGRSLRSCIGGFARGAAWRPDHCAQHLTWQQNRSPCFGMMIV